MSDALRNALERGLPYPMLSVLEYFSLNQDAFNWGRHYRVAGHYTHAVIWFALACWLLSILLILILPHYAYKSILATGCSLLVACLLYFIMSPCELKIAFTGQNLERVDLTATFSFCFYLIFAIGILCVICGLVLGICDHWRIYILSTFLDANLDEHVGPKWKKLPYDSQSMLRDVRVIDSKNEEIGEKGEMSSSKTHSSGFQSRTSTCHSSSSSASLRSQTSFETVHDEQELDQSHHVRFSQNPCSSTS